MPFVAAFTAAEIAAAEAAAIAAAEIAAAEAAAAAAAQAAAASTATAAAAPTAAAAAAPPVVGGPMAMGLPEATALAPMEAGIAGIPSAAEPALTATRSLAFGAEPVAAAGGSPATTAGVMQSPVAPVVASTPPSLPPQPTAADFLASGVQPPPFPPGPSAPPAGILQAAPPVAPSAAVPPAGPSPYALNAPASTPAPGPGSMQYQLRPPGTAGTEGLRMGATGTGGLQPSTAATNAMYQSPGPTAFDKFSAFADKHPFMTGAAMYTAASGLGLLNPEGEEMPRRRSYGQQYTLSPDFRAMDPTANVYKPSYPQYAEGGIMGAQDSGDALADGGVPGYAKGGTLYETLDFYKNLAEGEKGKGASAPKGEDVGIYYDLDPDTRYQDALTAAQIRQAKLNKRTNVRMPSTGAMRRPTPMGQINLAPPGVKEETAAQGGIMQANDSSLGSYAAGGSPRLLRGPGDGMSDNIPAVIGRKQPARLADGEFVIPADVVSHLGNGSTEAGAKRLHEMMNKVRKARTGNSKQGKQINPKKYMPA